MSRRLWQAGSAATLALAALVGACRGRSDTGSTQDTSRNETAAINSRTATDSGSAAELSDANIVALLDEANKADSAAGALAVKKASSPEVKKFARLMMGEHHALRLEGEQVAKKASITPAAPANDPVAPLAAQETSVLDSTAAGGGFDRAYIEQEVAVHRAVKDLLDRATGAAQNADLKAAIGKAIPIIAHHLAEAERLQQKLAGQA